MHIAPPHPQEAERLLALEEVWADRVLHALPKAPLEAIVQLTAELCGTGIAAITLVGADEQRFAAEVGLGGAESTPRDVAFCAHTILVDDVLVIPDATEDERFAGNPLVDGGLGVRFYAGARVLSASGLPLGALCVVDGAPRELSAEQRLGLRGLARHVSAELELRRTVADLRTACEVLGPQQPLHRGRPRARTGPPSAGCSRSRRPPSGG